jgi:hypothetical protein
MKNVKILTILILVFWLMIFIAQVSRAETMGTAFTYQGRLIDANKPADGLYDLQFKLCDANVGGNKMGNDVNLADVNIINGYFTVQLDFGSNVFNGNACWLEIGVRPGELEDPNVYTSLSPRQKITPTPYALQTRGIFVDNTGNVGIGTTNPIGRFQVGTNYNHVRFDVDGLNAHVSIAKLGPDRGAGLFFEKDGIMLFYAGLTDSDLMGSGNEYVISRQFLTPDLLINGAGNVGIGTANPEQKLSVVGTVESTSGGFKFPDGTIQTTAGGSGIAVLTGVVSDGETIPLPSGYTESQCRWNVSIAAGYDECENPPDVGNGSTWCYTSSSHRVWGTQGRVVTVGNYYKDGWRSTTGRYPSGHPSTMKANYMIIGIK